MGSSKTTNQKSKRGYWQRHITLWKRSGLSQRQYCQSHSLALSTFGYWNRKLRKPQPAAAHFYPLTVPPITAPGNNKSDSGLRLCFRDKKYQVDIAKEFSSTSLKKLISTLERL